MTPEELRADIVERVRALESRMAEVQSDQAASRTEMASIRREISDLRHLVQSLVPIGERTAVLIEQTKQLDDDVNRVEMKFDKRWDRLESSQADARKDSRSLKNLLIGVGIAAVASPLVAFFYTAIINRP